MNDDDEKYQFRNVKPYEFYGFLKPRMWDQYADNYKGVCLALSLTELKKINGLIHDRINYLDYNNFLFKDHHIDLNGLAIKGDDEYSKEYVEIINKMLFNKHVDYSGENEYRFCKFNEETHYDIDISNCLRGIIISENYISEFAQNALLKYARELDIELIKINWTSSGFYLSNKNQIESILRLIEELTSS